MRILCLAGSLTWPSTPCSAGSLAGNPSARSIYGNAGLLLLGGSDLRRHPSPTPASGSGSSGSSGMSFLVGMTLWILGHIGWIVSQIGTGRSLVGPMAHDVQPVRRARDRWWRFLSRPHRGAREDATGGGRPSSWPPTACSARSSTRISCWCRASCRPRPATPKAMLLWLVQVQRLLLMAALSRLCGSARERRGRRPTSGWRSASAVGFFLRARRPAWRSRANDYHLGTRARLRLDRPVPLLPVGGPGSAGVRAAWKRFRSRPRSSRRRSLLSVVPVLAVPLIGYGLLRVQPLGDPGDSFRVLLTTMTIVCGLGPADAAPRRSRAASCSAPTRA